MVLGGLFVAFIFTGMYLTYAQDSIVINEVCSDNYSIGLNNGELCDYVELYNPSYVDVSLQGYSLSEIKDGKEKYVVGNVTIPGKSFLLIKFNGEAEAEDAANLQAPFKLSQKGESLYLHNASQEVIDFVQIPGLDYDEAYARVRDGRKEWSRSFCSPAESNVKKAIEEAVLFSQESGFYEEPFSLELQSPKGGQIFYTLDGSVPDENSLLYTEPIWVTDISEQEDRYSDNPDMSDFFNSVFEEKSDKALVVRALHIDEEGKKSAASEAVYFVGYQDKRGYEDVAVISIVADPQDLFGGEKGIYVLGDDYKAGVEGAGPNYTRKGKEWERQAAITFFNEKHEKLFSQQCGVRIQGASKRFNSQKCLTINTGYRYGEPYLKEHILGEPYEISQMIMKGTAYYIPRDVLPYELVKERQIGIPNYRYSAVFLNGEYWGLYVLKEKYNGNYFEQHFGIDRDNVILLKQTLLEEGMPGEEMSYLDMVDFACTHDLTVPENYAYVCELMDVQNFIDYFCTQMYICNMDFSMRHNCYTWRSREVGDGIGEDGKWRWLLYDIDYSAWMDINTTYTINSFTDNMPWSDLTAIEDPLFQALMKNENFRRQFVTTFMDFVNSCFQTGQVLNIIDDYAEILEEPMRISMERFEYEAALDTMVNFNSVREFYENRTPYITGYLAEVFELQGQPATVQIESLEPEGGEITVNTICPDFTETGSFEGQYYTDYPITVTAIPKEGYRFAGWSGDIDTKEAGITLDLPKQGVLLLAEFEKE